MKVRSGCFAVVLGAAVALSTRPEALGAGTGDVLFEQTSGAETGELSGPGVLTTDNFTLPESRTLGSILFSLRVLSSDRGLTFDPSLVPNRINIVRDPQSSPEVILTEDLTLADLLPAGGAFRGVQGSYEPFLFCLDAPLPIDGGVEHWLQIGRRDFPDRGEPQVEVLFEWEAALDGDNLGPGLAQDAGPSNVALRSDAVDYVFTLRGADAARVPAGAAIAWTDLAAALAATGGLAARACPLRRGRPARNV